MHQSPLFLSHWDASIPVTVPVNVAGDLQNYQVMGVRFLYDCFQKEQNGCVLNHEDGMNFAIQISAFFNALRTFITPQSPVLIVCSDESTTMWHYHLIKHGEFDVTLLSARNSEEIIHGDGHKVILSTVDNTKLLREIKGINFFAIVVDQLDTIATKAIIKQLKSNFNIGLTNRNFLKEPDQKLFWTIANWANSGAVGKCADFCLEDNNHLENLRYPYGAWWQRLTWKFSDTFKPPSAEEQKQYKTVLRNWSSRCNNQAQKPAPKRQTRKRKAVMPVQDEDDKLKIKQEDVLQSLVDTSPSKQSTKKGTKNLPTNNKSFDTKNCKNSNSSDKTNDQNEDDSENLNYSQSTIVYDLENSESIEADDNPILSSIVGSFDQSKTLSFEEFEEQFKESKTINKLEVDIKKEKQSNSSEVLSMLFGEPKPESQTVENDILTSIING